MPKVSQEHREARRQQILDAALECFAREGFHRTTMQEIVQQSELSPGAIYSYFKSKEEIIIALADERHAQEKALISVAGEQEDAGKILRDLGQSFLGALLDADEQKRRRVGVQLWAEALRNPQLLAIVRRGVDEPRRQFAALLSDLQQRGEFPARLSPDATARMMIALFQGFILQQAWDEQADVSSYIHNIEELFQLLLSWEK
jgi:AcrR family transcriptional regulator